GRKSRGDRRLRASSLARDPARVSRRAARAGNSSSRPSGSLPAGVPAPPRRRALAEGGGGAALDQRKHGRKIHGAKRSISDRSIWPRRENRSQIVYSVECGGGGRRKTTAQMTNRLSAHEVYDLAAHWAAKADAGALSPEDQTALDEWLDADIRHLGAFAQASAMLLPIGAAAPSARAVTRRHVVLGGPIAAGLAALGAAGRIVVRCLDDGRYRTSIGEMRVVPLSDGSVISLNTDSEVVIAYSDARRSIQLIRGEALFDVSKDPLRPFVVRAGEMEVRAVGTSFTVR